MRIRSLFSAAVILTTGCANVTVKTDIEMNHKTDITTQLKNIYTRSDLPGFAVVVVDNQRIIYQNIQGYADLAEQKPFTAQTVQNIGSVSKTVIAFAIMKAVELGHLKLDDPINQYLEYDVINPHHPDKAITVRHLTTHTSGISDSDAVYARSYVLADPEIDVVDEELAAYINPLRGNELIDDAEFLKRTLSKNGKWFTTNSFIKDAPGETYHYSNIGAALAAHVVERAVGMRYETFTEKYLFGPLLMKQTGWDEQAFLSENFAQRYYPGDVEVPDYWLVTRADGGLYTNANDFAQYMIEMLNGAQGHGELLSSDSYQEMFRRVVFDKESSGVFWSINDKLQPNHSGGDPGILTVTSLRPKLNRAFFFMTNISADEDKRLMKSVKKVLKAVSNHFK